MHILLTGAFGFVGINLVRTFAILPNVTVTATDLHMPTPAARAFLAPVWDRVRILPLDVTDRHATQQVVTQAQPTHIVHAAGLTPSIEQERNNPTRIVDVNLNAVVNVLDAARATASVERIVNVSSSGVYGAPPANSPQRQLEDGPFSLGGLYAITKYSAELFAARYAQLGTQQITSVRLPPVYGLMETRSPSRPRISQVGMLLEALLAKQSVRIANINSNPAMNVVRDWTHVDDIAAAIHALLVAKQWSYPVYNVSYGEGVAFATLVETFIHHGLQVEWVDDPTVADIAIPPHLARLPLDIQRLQSDTDFVPRVTFAEGVARILW